MTFFRDADEASAQLLGMAPDRRRIISKACTRIDGASRVSSRPWAAAPKEGNRDEEYQHGG
jgi:hypothetical protein